MFKLKKTELINITLLFISWRVFLFVLAFLAPKFFNYQPSFAYPETLQNYHLPAWIYSFANFDGIHYLTIANKGYFGIGLIQAFFPLYPLLIRLFTVIQANSLINSLVISNLFAYLFILNFYLLVKQEFSTAIAQKSLLILLTFPSSFFLGASYNESLFLFLTISSLLLIKKKNWFLASTCASLAAATRLVGIFLLPVLLIELWQVQIQQTTSKHFNLMKKFTTFIHQSGPLLMICLISTFGLLSYMVYLHFRFNDALFFLHVQTEFGAGRQEAIILYPQVIFRYLKILLTARPFNYKYFSYVQDFIAGTSVLFLIVKFYKKIKFSYLIFSLLAFFLPTMTGTFSSIPRYILVCFPIYIILAHIFTQKKLNTLIWYLYLISSSIILIINTMLFIQGYWVA